MAKNWSTYNFDINCLIFESRHDIAEKLLIFVLNTNHSLILDITAFN